MRFNETPLKGSYLIDLEPRLDERGFFSRFFCEQEFSAYGLITRWSQINNSLSNKAGTLRGLHFQRPPHAEVKLVRCIHGSIWDVIVDLRAESDTFGRWFGAEMTAVNRTMMYVPKGFAHGFISLLPNSEIFYLVSDPYAPGAEETLHFGDPQVNIIWPMQISCISLKDSLGLKLGKVLPVVL